MIDSVLKNITIKNNIVILPDIQLDRKDYLAVKKRLEGIGGKWNRKANGFVFKNGIPAEIDNVKQGDYINLQKKYQFFETPENIAKRLVSYAKIKSGDQILEPSAGQGAIISEILKNKNVKKVYCYELHKHNIDILTKKFGNKIDLLGHDFTKKHINTEKYDKIIANPPFSNNQDIQHIYIMYNLLRVGGKLVVITSKHWQIASNRKELEFSEWLNKTEHQIYNLPERTFKKSGTDIETLLIVINKTKEISTPDFERKNKQAKKRNNIQIRKIYALLSVLLKAKNIFINKDYYKNKLPSQYRFTQNDAINNLSYSFDIVWDNNSTYKSVKDNDNEVARWYFNKEILEIKDFSENSKILGWLAQNSYMTNDEYMKWFYKEFEKGGNVDDKIEDYLKEKQKNKQLKDTSIVNYTKKYKRAVNSISLNDLSEIEKNSVDAYKLITKDNFWEKYDIEELKKDHYSGIAYYKIELRKSFANRPPDNPEYRKIYTEFVLDLLESLKDYKTDVVKLRNDFLRKIIDRYINEYGISKLKKIISARFIYLAAYSGHSKSAERIIENAIFYNYSLSDIEKKKTEFLQTLEDYRVNLKGKITEENLSEKELNEVTKNISIIYDCTRNILENKFDCIKNNRYKFPFHRGRRLYEIYEIGLKNFTNTGNWSWVLKDEKDKKTKKDRRSPEIFNVYEKYGIDIEDVKYRKPLSQIIRIKGLEIPEITTGSIQKYFGYKDVVFGNYMSSKEGREHARHFLASMLDLAEILDVDIKQINQFGGLSIAFGAMGCGGRASACYYPQRKVINLTKKNGDGSLAHEWGHYLDNIIADKDIHTGTPEFSSKIYGTSVRDRIGHTVYLTLSDLIHYIKYAEGDGNADKYISVTFYPDRTDSEKRYNFKHITGKEDIDWETAVEKGQKRHPHIADYNRLMRDKNAKLFYRWVAAVYNDNKPITIKLKLPAVSQFYANSLLYETNPKKPYWTSVTEMFARAFESYVLYKLKKEKRESTYLVSINYPEVLTDTLPYPKGHELDKISEKFDALISAIKKDYGIKNFSWYTKKRNDFFSEKERNINHKILALLKILTRKLTEK